GVRDVGPVGVDARVALGEGDARPRHESENREHHTNRPAHRTPRLDATLQLRTKAQAARQGGTTGRDLLMSLRTTALTRAEDQHRGAGASERLLDGPADATDPRIEERGDARRVMPSLVTAQAKTRRARPRSGVPSTLAIPRSCLLSACLARHV